MPLVQVTLIEGRSAEVKRELIAELTDAVVRATGAAAASVRVILNEVPAAHWGVGGRPKGDEASPHKSRTDA
jgi:4-oxalocrotonate tautomerase